MISPSEPAASAALLADVDPAFTDPARPALYVQHVPAEGEVAALLADRARLRDFLAHGHRLFRLAASRQWRDAGTRPLDRKADGTVDPSYGQRSNADGQRATLDLYSWLQHYGPCLVLLLDQALLDGAIDRAWRAARALPAPTVVDMQPVTAAELSEMPAPLAQPEPPMPWESTS